MALQDALNNLAKLRAPAVDNTRVAPQQPKQEVYDPATFVKRSDQLTGFIGYTGALSAGTASGGATGRATGLYAGRGASGFLFQNKYGNHSAIARHASAAQDRQTALKQEQLARQQAQQQGNGQNLYGLG